jgi:hypothetical protein
MHKILPSLAALVVTSVSFPIAAIAQNTIDTTWYPPDWGRVRVAQIRVSEQGVVLDFAPSGTTIRSITPSHLSHFVFKPLDGTLCQNASQCSGSAPSKIYIQRHFLRFSKDKTAPGGRTMLYVNTSKGFYRFELVPSSYTRQTLINIGNSPK